MTCAQYLKEKYGFDDLAAKSAKKNALCEQGVIANLNVQKRRQKNVKGY